MHDSSPGAAAEWRKYYMLPVAGALGYTTSVIHIYGFGPYIGPVSEAFGWTRTETTLGLTLATTVQAVMSVPIGLAVDRFGPRRFGVIGVLLLAAAFAALGLAQGSLTNWYLLWCLVALAALPVQATVWTSAVATRFKVSRGMAFAVTLCGASVATALFPVMATWLIGERGWQSAFAWQAGLWIVLAFPVIALFFRGARDSRNAPTETQEALSQTGGASLAEGLRSSIFLRLLLACLLFTLTIIAVVVHFVPILTDRGTGAMAAAGTASLIGIFSLIGRIGTGFLLDRFTGSKVGAAVFLLPVISCLLLLFGGNSFAMQAAAAALIGLTLGAEIDVVAFVTTQHFGLKNFGGLYGGLLAALSAGTALGPLAASAVFDARGSYAPYLWLTVGAMAISSLLLASLPKPTLEHG